MNYTVASFLREKVINMAVWLEGEGMQHSGLPELTDLALTTMAHTLHNDYGEYVKMRDFTGLHDTVLPEITELLQFVESREALHDKFWRYLELFSEVASTHG